MALAVLVEGSFGPDVANLQRALNYHLPAALPALVVDGIYGAKTRARLVHFQKKFDLKPDAIVGPKTQRALYSFVTCSHHLLIQDFGRPVVGRANAFGDGPALFPSPSLLPPLPRMQLPFPRPFRVPPVLRPPRLELDPNLARLIPSRPFEITAGTTMEFKKNDSKVSGFIDLEANVWSQPIGENVEVGASTGVGLETRVTDGRTEFHMFSIMKAEFKDILKLRNVDVARLQLEAKLEGKPGSKEPADMSGTIKLGPTIEVKNGRVTFGFGGYMQYKSNGDTHSLTGGVFLEGGARF